MPSTPKPRFVRHLPRLLQVQIGFGAGLMHILERRARQFKLAARLQRQRSAVQRVADNVLALFDRLPAKALHAFQQGAADALASQETGLLGLEGS